MIMVGGIYDSGTQMIGRLQGLRFKIAQQQLEKDIHRIVTNGVYTMKYADLDGANESTVLIDKADFAGSPLALFSFGAGTPRQPC